jgi:hypothetical protein
MMLHWRKVEMSTGPYSSQIFLPAGKKFAGRPCAGMNVLGPSRQFGPPGRFCCTPVLAGFSAKTILGLPVKSRRGLSQTLMALWRRLTTVPRQDDTVTLTTGQELTSNT